MQNNNTNATIIFTRNLLIIILIILVIFSFTLYSKLHNIEQRVNQINYTINNNSNTNYVNYTQIKEIISQELENQTYLNVQIDWSGEYINDKIQLACNVILNQANPDDKLKIFYKNPNDTTWKSVDLSKNAGLRYSGNLSLDLFKEYEYYVMLDGKIMQTSKVTYIPSRYYLIERHLLYGEIEISNGKEMGALIHWEDLTRVKSLIKGVSFTSFRIDVYSDDKIIDSQLIDDFSSSDTKVSFESYDVRVDKIVAVAILSGGQELENIVYEFSHEKAIEDKKRDSQGG